jgi:glutamine synthetase adenylyltransferase
MGVLPDQAMEDMACLLQEGVRQLDHAFSHLGNDARQATESADAAIKTQRRLERVYRRAMSELIENRDLREVLARQELYRRLTAMSDRVVGVAERVWYASVKEA